MTQLHWTILNFMYVRIGIIFGDGNLPTYIIKSRFDCHVESNRGGKYIYQRDIFSCFLTDFSSHRTNKYKQSL